MLARLIADAFDESPGSIARLKEGAVEERTCGGLWRYLMHEDAVIEKLNHARIIN